MRTLTRNEPLDADPAVTVPEPLADRPWRRARNVQRACRGFFVGAHATRVIFQARSRLRISRRNATRACAVVNLTAVGLTVT
jgi:hypothetical protein